MPLSTLTTHSYEVMMMMMMMSVPIQRFKAIMLHDSFVDKEAGTGIST